MLEDSNVNLDGVRLGRYRGSASTTPKNLFESFGYISLPFTDKPKGSCGSNKYSTCKLE